MVKKNCFCVFFINICNLKKGKDILILCGAYLCYIQANTATMYSVSKSTFKLMKPAEIYMVHHYETVLVSLSWLQINSHKYKPGNDEAYEQQQRTKSNNLKKYYRTYFNFENPILITIAAHLNRFLTCLDLQRHFGLECGRPKAVLLCKSINFLVTICKHLLTERKLRAAKLIHMS